MTGPVTFGLGIDASGSTTGAQEYIRNIDDIMAKTSTMTATMNRASASLTGPIDAAHNSLTGFLDEAANMGPAENKFTAIFSAGEEGSGRLRRELDSLLLSTLPVESGLGRLATGLGGLAIGGPEVIAALAGVAALEAIYKQMTAASDELTERTQKLTDELNLSGQKFYDESHPVEVYQEKLGLLTSEADRLQQKLNEQISPSSTSLLGTLLLIAVTAPNATDAIRQYVGGLDALQAKLQSNADATGELDRQEAERLKAIAEQRAQSLDKLTTLEQSGVIATAKLQLDSAGSLQAQIAERGRIDNLLDFQKYENLEKQIGEMKGLSDAEQERALQAGVTEIAYEGHVRTLKEQLDLVKQIADIIQLTPTTVQTGPESSGPDLKIYDAAIAQRQTALQNAFGKGIVPVDVDPHQFGLPNDQDFKDAAKEYQQFESEVSRELRSTFDNIIDHGVTSFDSLWQDALKGFARMLADMEAKALAAKITPAISNLIGGPTGLPTGFSGAGDVTADGSAGAALGSDLLGLASAVAGVGLVAGMVISTLTTESQDAINAHNINVQLAQSFKDLAVAQLDYKDALDKVRGVPTVNPYPLTPDGQAAQTSAESAYPGFNYLESDSTDQLKALLDPGNDIPVAMQKFIQALLDIRTASDTATQSLNDETQAALNAAAGAASYRQALDVLSTQAGLLNDLATATGDTGLAAMARQLYEVTTLAQDAAEGWTADNLSLQRQIFAAQDAATANQQLAAQAQAVADAAKAASDALVTLKQQFDATTGNITTGNNLASDIIRRNIAGDTDPSDVKNANLGLLANTQANELIDLNKELRDGTIAAPLYAAAVASLNKEWNDATASFDGVAGDVTQAIHDMAIAAQTMVDNASQLNQQFDVFGTALPGRIAGLEQLYGLSGLTESDLLAKYVKETDGTELSDSDKLLDQHISDIIGLMHQQDQQTATATADAVASATSNATPSVSGAASTTYGASSAPGPVVMNDAVINITIEMNNETLSNPAAAAAAIGKAVAIELGARRGIEGEAAGMQT